MKTLGNYREETRERKKWKSISLFLPLLFWFQLRPLNGCFSPSSQKIFLKVFVPNSLNTKTAHTSLRE